MSSVKVFDTIPTEVTLDHESFLRFLGGPAIIKAGKGDECIFISCLMHGNEPSSFFAAHRILNELYKEDNLNKTVYFAFMNVRAAIEGGLFANRFCDDEMDMNRIWGKQHSKNGLQEDAAKFIMRFITLHDPIMVLDIHNTTGANPVFAIISEFRKENIEAAAVMSDVVWYANLNGTLTGWVGQICPSITVECGKNIDTQSHENAYKAIKKLFMLCNALQGDVKPNKQLRLLHSVERIDVLSTDVEVSHKNTGNDVVLRPDIEEFNTVMLEPGTPLGWINKQDILLSSFVEVKDRQMILKEPCTFILITTYLDAINKDALGYRALQKKVSYSELLEKGERILD